MAPKRRLPNVTAYFLFAEEQRSAVKGELLAAGGERPARSPRTLESPPTAYYPLGG